MGKLVAILGVCVVAAGGAAYGLYAYTDVFDSGADLGNYPVAQSKCCGGPDGCCPSNEDANLSAAVAVAGPVGVVPPTSPISTGLPCCQAKAGVAFKGGCCEDVCPVGGIESSGGLSAVAGTAATATK